ncbi:hypothetical protein EMIT079MI2_40042 [Bacillus sp. IT-79MI2]
MIRKQVGPGKVTEWVMDLSQYLGHKKIKFKQLL